MANIPIASTGVSQSAQWLVFYSIWTTALSVSSSTMSRTVRSLSPIWHRAVSIIRQLVSIRTSISHLSQDSIHPFKRLRNFSSLSLSLALFFSLVLRCCVLWARCSYLSKLVHKWKEKWKWNCSCRTSVDWKIKYCCLWSSPIEWLKKKSVAYCWLEVRVPVHTMSLIWTDFMTFVMFMSESFVLLHSSACCSSHWLITRVVIHFSSWTNTHISVTRVRHGWKKKVTTCKRSGQPLNAPFEDKQWWCMAIRLRPTVDLFHCSSATFKHWDKKSENTDWTKVATPEKAIRMW